MPTDIPPDAPPGPPEGPRNSLRALLDGTVRVEGDDLPVSDAWIDRHAMALRYVGLDVGGWLDRHVALVSAERLAWSRDAGGAGGWRADLGRAEIEADEARLQEGRGWIDIAALPPVITGPFGFTVSPMLIGAGLLSEAEEERPPHPPGGGEGEEASGRTRALDRAGDWLDAPVKPRPDGVGPKGEAEARLSIADLLIDPADLSVTHAVIEVGGRPRAVPLLRLDPRPEDGEPVPLDLTLAEIEAMPEVVAPSRDP